MTTKTPTPPLPPRWPSLLGTAILLLVIVFVYLRTGTVPDELLEGALGRTTATVADRPTTVVVIEATATERVSTAPTAKPTDTPTGAPTDTPTGTPTGTPTAALAAAEQPTKAATATSTSLPTRKPKATPTATRPPTRAPPTATSVPTRIRSQSGLPVILYNDLPPEAKETIRLIENNGPFPFRQDDSTFQNREGILPRQSRDWYREFTVITPGSRDRGARRIIEGEDGLLFYTDDHYASFREVIR